jgi:hypothetical protein
VIYRSSHRDLILEEELWQRLDWALEESLRDPVLAWAMVWDLLTDADINRYPDLVSAASGLAEALIPDVA